MASIVVLAWVAVASAVIKMGGGGPLNSHAFAICQVACLASALIEVGAMDDGKAPSRFVFVTRAAAVVAFLAQVWAVSHA